MSQQLREEITSQLCASAENSQKRSVDIRVARDVDSVQVDLNDDTHDAVHVSETRQGFTVSPTKNISFHRPMKQQPLPRPVLIETSDFIKLFRKFMPEFAFGHWILILAFILKAFNRDCGSFPILAIEGPQGSGKTIFSRRI